MLIGPWEDIVRDPLFVSLQGVRRELCRHEFRGSPAVAEDEVRPPRAARFQHPDGGIESRIRAQIENLCRQQWGCVGDGVAISVLFETLPQLSHGPRMARLGRCI